MISAIILTKNEENNLAECLAGVKWCDEILVIDDESSDKTVPIAKKAGARVIEHKLGADFAAQRNFALDQAQGDWIFFVDADERVSPELAEEIQKKIENSSVLGYFLKRSDFFMGRRLRFGEIDKIKILRLAKKSSGRWRRRVDEKWEVEGKTTLLENSLVHYSHVNLTNFLTTINERSSLNARQFFEEGIQINFWEWVKPLAKFVWNYFFLLGFLDGATGLVFAVLMSLHSFLVRGKLYLLWAKGDLKSKRDQKLKILFIAWAIFVFGSYIFFLYQRGLSKW